METKDESRLLALPLELLTRVTDNLNDESLPSLRLACKTLEGATFNRFVKTLQNTTCCIYYESRWLSLKRFLNGSPRLVNAVHGILFTTDPLEGKSCHEVQIAPGQEFDDIEAAQRQFDITEAEETHLYEPLHADRRASPALIHSVLFDIENLAPDVYLIVDLGATRFFRDENYILDQDIFLAIATTSCHVDHLVFSRHSCDDLEDVTEYLGGRLLSCISHMETFVFHSTDQSDEEFGSPIDEKNVETIVNILQHARNLSTLYLEMREHRYAEYQWTLTKQLLFANDFSNLDELSLDSIDIPESQLRKAIASCDTRLKRLALESIHLQEVEGGWLAVFRMLSVHSELLSLSLISLSANQGMCSYRAPRLDFCKVKSGHKSISYYDCDRPYAATSLLLRSRDAVSAGLQEILSEPLLLTEARPLSDE